MMRNAQNRAHRRAMKRALSDDSRGVFAAIRSYTRFHLALILLALGFSVILLFIGTFAYFHAHISRTGETNDSFYRRILDVLSIDIEDFEIFSKNDASSNQQNRIGLSVMFVASISLLVEICLLCAVLFEHTKLGFFTLALMGAAFVHHIYLYEKPHQLQFYPQQHHRHHLQQHQHPRASLSLSLVFQILLFISTTLFLFGIRVKSYVASRTFTNNCHDMELLTNAHKQPLASP